MPKTDVNICYRDVEEPMEFENIDSFEIVKGGKFLFLYCDSGNGLEYYIPLENVLYFAINYKGEGK